MSRSTQTERRRRLGGRGVASVELALALPLLIASTIVAVDMVTLLRGHLRMERTAGEIANVTAQYQRLREADIRALFLAAAAIAEPWSISGAEGALVLTGVLQESGGPRIAWQRRVGELSCISQIGERPANAPPTPATLPPSLVLAAGQTVIVAEACTNLLPRVVFPELWERLLRSPDPTVRGQVAYSYAIFRPRTAQLATVEP